MTLRFFAMLAPVCLALSLIAGAAYWLTGRVRRRNRVEREWAKELDRMCDRHREVLDSIARYERTR